MFMGPGFSSRSSFLVFMLSSFAIGAFSLAPSLVQARVCDGTTNDKLVEMKKGLEDYKQDPLAFHRNKVEFELYVGKNCDSPIKKYVAGSDYAQLQKNAYLEAAKASATKAIDFKSHAQADDQNVARITQLTRNIDDFARYAGTSPEAVLRDAGVPELKLLEATKEAYKADLASLVGRLEESERILKMSRDEYPKYRKQLLGAQNSPSRLIARFEEAKAQVDVNIPTDLKKRVEALSEARLTKIFAMENCRILEPKPDFPNCADSLTRKMLAKSDNEIRRIVNTANASSRHHQQGEAKLREVQRSGGPTKSTTGTR